MTREEILATIKPYKSLLPYQYMNMLLKDLNSKGLTKTKWQVRNFMQGMIWDEEIFISVKVVAVAYGAAKVLEDRGKKMVKELM